MFAAALWNSLCLSARQPILLRCGWHPDTSSKTMTIYLTDGRHHVDIVCRRDKSLTWRHPQPPCQAGSQLSDHRARATCLYSSSLFNLYNEGFCWFS